MAVSVVGFDVGCLTSYIAVAKGGGIETITNEYSDRQTPTCVAFAGRRRLIGTNAKLQHVTNISNTFVNFLPLVGKKYSDGAISSARKCLPYPVEEGADGRASITVNYNDAVHQFSPEQLLAMQLSKLKSITEVALNNKVVDVVINVPTYYTDAERRGMLDASRIVGLNCVKLVNDLTAIGTAYGLYKSDLPPTDQPSKVVAFVSVGYTSTQVGICAFNNGKMKMLSTACDSQLGGRDFDRIIFDKLAADFQASYKLKVCESKKATVRLVQECEKLKKAMSANSQELPVSIECLMNDRDLNSRMKRSDFEELAADILARFEKVLLRCLSLGKVNPQDVHAVEVVGGSSRIPALKSIVASVFKQDVRTTLNADEVVARGCALQAAICSPAYKVREFSVTEVCPYAITLHWDREDSGDQNMAVVAENEKEVTVEGKDTSLEVFPLLHHIPSSRRLFFNRRGPFMLEARYSVPEELPNQNSLIGLFRVYDLPENVDVNRIRVKVRINSHGVFSVSQAEVAEEYEKEVEVDVPEEKANGSPEGSKTNNAEKSVPVDAPSNGDVNMESTPGENTPTDGQQQEPAKKDAPKKMVVKKKAIRYKEVPVEASIMQFSTKQLNDFCEIEGKLYEQDELEHRRANAKNSVEEYVYEMRSKLQDNLNSFSTPNEQETLSRALDATEDWLYGDGEDVHRQVYVDRLNELKLMGDPIELRATEYNNRDPAINQFHLSIVRIRKLLESVSAGEDTYSHLTEEQLNTLQTTLVQNESWLHEKIRTQKSRAKTDDPIVKVAEIVAQQKTMESVCHPIMSTPKPVVPPPTSPSETPDTNNANETTATESNCVNKKGKSAKAAKGQEKSEHMDVD